MFSDHRGICTVQECSCISAKPPTVASLFFEKKHTQKFYYRAMRQERNDSKGNFGISSALNFFSLKNWQKHSMTKSFLDANRGCSKYT